MSNYHITTTITAIPFRCVVCGYVDGVLHTRLETDDPWVVMFAVDTVHQLIGAVPACRVGHHHCGRIDD